jgi:hypothetical protein
MVADEDVKTEEQTNTKAGLQLLRSPFPDNLIGKLPKPTKAQTDSVKKDYKKGVRCDICGGWHHPKVVHLDYVGHAALTDRLLDVDVNWYWEPVAFGDDGLPKFDTSGGLWINLTVLGVTRLGYGHAPASQYKEIGSREKEVIGDALRNAAMRFGAALDLWHKGDLHLEGNGESEKVPEKETVDDKKLSVYNEAAGKCKTSDEVNAWMEENAAKIKEELNNTERAILRDTCLKIKIILDTVTDE